MGNYLLSNRGEGWPCGVSHLRPSSEKSIGTRSVRELGRLRRASTVEIHGRDIVGGIRRGANFVSKRTSLAAFLGKKRRVTRDPHSSFCVSAGVKPRAHLRCEMINGIGRRRYRGGKNH